MTVPRMLAVLATAVLAAGCDEPVTRSGTTEAAAAAAGEPSLSYGPTASVAVHCPANLEGGQSGQCVAFGYDAGGRFTTSSGATWSTTTPALISVSSSGEATAAASGSGTATVSATLAGITGSTTIAIRNLSVTLHGQNTLRAGEICTWWANAANGSGSYTYTWTVLSGSPIGSGSGNTWVGKSSSSFTLKVKVSDGTSTVFASKSVSVSNTGSPCIA